MWWFPCQKKRIHTVCIWFWPTLYIIFRVGQNHTHLRTYGSYTAMLSREIAVRTVIYLGLARTVNIHRIRPYIW